MRTALPETLINHGKVQIYCEIHVLSDSGFFSTSCSFSHLHALTTLHCKVYMYSPNKDVCLYSRTSMSIVDCMSSKCTKVSVLLNPGWKDMRNFVMPPYLHVRAPINAMRLIFMCNLRTRVN